MRTDSDGWRAERSDPSLELPIEMATTGEFFIPPTLSEDPIGRIGRYEIMGRLAVGGMAEIYLAREKATGDICRYLVVKVVRPHLAGQPDFGEMFLNEGRVALRLKHPNICPVYEFGVEKGRYFIAMEYVHGVTMREVLVRAVERQEPLPVPVVVRIVAHVAEALSSAHRTVDEDGRGVVHRDVTPQNIIVGFDGVVKLLDFGIAEAQGDRRDAESRTFKGKVSYLAPEQCKGAAVDGRSDIFSLGVCMWEALTGRPLWRRKNDVESMMAIVNDPVPSPNDYGADAPPEVLHVLERALQKDPAERFQTAGEMSRALQQYLVDIRQLVDTSRIAAAVGELFPEEARRGPVLDRSAEVVDQLGSLAETEPELPDTGSVPARPLSPRKPRRGLGLLAALGALVLAAGVAWAVARPDVSVGGSSVAPTAAAPSSGEGADETAGAGEASDAPTSVAAEEEAADAGAAVADAEPDADEQADEPDRERRPRKRLRTKRGFLVEPDF